MALQPMISFKLNHLPEGVHAPSSEPIKSIKNVTFFWVGWGWGWGWGGTNKNSKDYRYARKTEGFF